MKILKDISVFFFFLKSYYVNEASKLILHDCLYDHVKTLDL